MRLTFRHCLRPGCGRELHAEASLRRGYGPRCWARLLRAIRILEASGNRVASGAAEILRDAALAPMLHVRITGVWACVSATGHRIYHLTTEHCSCPAGQRRIPLLCKHRVALTVLTA